MTKILREGADSVEAITSRTAATNESHAREAQHSPLPFQMRPGVCRHDHPDTSADVHGAHGEFVADCGCHSEANANAALIVRACNHHEALLAALKAVVAVLQKEAPGTPMNHHQYDAVGAQALKAIANAEGK